MINLNLGNMKTIDTGRLPLVALKEEETGTISGGRNIRGILLTAALFMACPAVGVFHLGVREGYREAAGM